MFSLFTGTANQALLVFGNSPATYLKALILATVLFLVIKLFESVILGRLRSLADKTKTDIDNLGVDIFCSIHSSYYGFVAIWVASRLLVFPNSLQNGLYAVLILWTVYELIRALKIVVDFILKRQVQGGNKNSSAIAGLLRQLLIGLLWTVGFLLVLSNLGLDITSLIAGLGIGGIAIALALQNILKDLFGAFSIYFDKPFEVGDFIVVGDLSGTVEKIGIKTTRVRSLEGEEIVFANEDLTASRIHNYRKLKKRRVVFTLGVTYDTAQEKLQRIPDMVKEIIQKTDQTQFDRAHFREFADSSLNFEVVYFVLSQDYNTYCDVHQNVLLAINQAFTGEQIGFAFPSQTVYLEK